MTICSIKRKCTFVVGFVLGFALALVLLDSEDSRHGHACDKKYAWLCNSNPRTGQKRLLFKVAPENTDFSSWLRENGLNARGNLSYKAWLESQGIKVSGVNLDREQYGPKQENKARNSLRLLESEWLKSKVHVTCVVAVEKLRRAKAIQDSWGASCNRLYLFSEHVNDTDLNVRTFPMKLTSSWQVLCESMNYVWRDFSESNSTENQESLQWVIFVKDDTMVIPENLRYLVAPLDPKNGHYLGHPIVLWGQAYNIAQAGFVLSRGAFRKIVENFDTHQKCASGGRYWKKEDYYLGKHLALLGIHPADTRDHFQRGVFHGYSLATLLWGIARPGSYFTRALYPPGQDCCSPKSITFSTSEPAKMYTVNYMLYHLNVYSGPAIYGKEPAPTPVPEEEIWKSALREEFNITDVDNVDSQQYYKIWRSRYSDPEQLIRKNTWNLANARRFLPSDYKTRSNMFN